MTASEAIKMLQIQKPAYGCKEYQKPLMYAYEMAIKALEEVQQYRAIGTPEECREAVEKQTDEKPTAVLGTFGGTEYECKNCGSDVCYGDEYCRWCGQKLDWSDEDENKMIQSFTLQKRN